MERRIDDEEANKANLLEEGSERSKREDGDERMAEQRKSRLLCFLALMLIGAVALVATRAQLGMQSLPTTTTRRGLKKLAIEETTGDFPPDIVEMIAVSLPPEINTTEVYESTTTTIPTPIATSTSSTTMTNREIAISTVLKNVVGEVINNPSTPYEMALDWILFQDPLRLSATSANLVQRYILALFYFKTSQQGPWRSCNPPSSGQNSSCTNYEIQRQPDNSIAYFPSPRLDTRWLSGTNECRWAFIQCTTDKTVTTIDILGQGLTGTLPEDLLHLKYLEWLSLSYNQFVGTIPTQYGTFQNLKIFECTENLLTGPVPQALYEKPKMLQLNLAYNMFTGTLPTTIGNMTSMHSIFYFNTLLEGTLPTELGRLRGLHNLWMFDNQDLFGPIPSEMGNLALLEDLKLSHNGHSGPLPSELGRLGNLQEFLFAYNRMGGTTIPEEFWDMSSLIYLDLNGAGLGGTLSTNIGTMTTLKGIKFSRNQFVGTIPTELGQLSDLILLWVHINPGLSGDVPNEVCTLRSREDLSFLNADCHGAGNSPRVQCPYGCCTGCCDQFGSCRLV